MIFRCLYLIRFAISTKGRSYINARDQRLHYVNYLGYRIKAPIQTSCKNGQ